MYYCQASRRTGAIVRSPGPFASFTVRGGDAMNVFILAQWTEMAELRDTTRGRRYWGRVMAAWRHCRRVECQLNGRMEVPSTYNAVPSLLTCFPTRTAL